MKLLSAQFPFYFLVILICLITAPPVYAVTSAATPTVKATDRAQQRLEELESRKEEALQKKEAMLENRCAMITKRLQTRVEHYNSVKEAKINQYQHAKEVLQAIMKRLKAKGCETQALEADLESLDTFIKDFSTTYQTFITSLTTAESNVCKEQKSASYAKTAQAAQEQLKLVREKGTAIRNLYVRSIKKDIQQLRLECNDAQKPKSATASANRPIKVRQEAQ